MAASVLKPNLGNGLPVRVATLIGAAFLSMGGFAGVAAQTQPAVSISRFEVASVRLMLDRDKLPLQQRFYSISPSGAGEFIVRNVPLPNLIGMAFHISESQISGGPKWFDSSFYEIEAKPPGDAGLSYEQLEPFLQQLLWDRFRLEYHRETKGFKGFRLVVAKGGPKLTPSKSDAKYAYIMRGEIVAQNTPVNVFALMLSHTLGQPVADKTGLKGKYDFHIQFAPLDAADSTQPSIFTAVEEQVGLRLEKATVPVELLVIDHVDRIPTPN